LAGAGGVQDGECLVELTGFEQGERRVEQLRREHPEADGVTHVQSSSPRVGAIDVHLVERIRIGHPALGQHRAVEVDEHVAVGRKGEQVVGNVVHGDLAGRPRGDAVHTGELGNHRERGDEVEVQRRCVTSVRIDADVTDLVLFDHPINRRAGALRCGQPSQDEAPDHRHEHDDADQTTPPVTHLCTRQRERCLHAPITPRLPVPDKDAGLTRVGVLAPHGTHRSVTSPPLRLVATFEA
jgi:hypothetical protein